MSHRGPGPVARLDRPQDLARLLDRFATRGLLSEITVASLRTMRWLRWLLLLALLTPTTATQPLCCDAPASDECCSRDGTCPTLPTGECVRAAETVLGALPIGQIHVPSPASAPDPPQIAPTSMSRPLVDPTRRRTNAVPLYLALGALRN
jgi:hypothetical protein